MEIMGKDIHRDLSSRVQPVMNNSLVTPVSSIEQTVSQSLRTRLGLLTNMLGGEQFLHWTN